MKTTISRTLLALLVVGTLAGAGLAATLARPDASATATAYALPPTKDGTPPPAIDWGRLDAAPSVDRLPTYDVLPSPENEASARAHAARFGLRGDAVAYDASRGAYYLMDEGDRHEVVVRETGGMLLYRDPATIYATVDRQPDLPAEAEGRALALAFLARTGTAPAPGEFDAENPVYYRPQQGEVNGTTGVTTTYDTNLEVRFPRLLSGVPAYGPGAALYVHFSDGKVVSGLTKLWPDVRAGPAKAVIGPQEASQRAAADGRFDTPPGCARAKVESAQLTYFVPGPADAGKVAFPTYVFRGSCAAADGTLLDGGFRVDVPAVR